MYTNKLSLTEVIDGEYESFNVEINAYHVRVCKIDRKSGASTNEVLFQRGTFISGNTDDSWLDEKHKKVIDAMNALRSALLDAIDVHTVEVTTTDGKFGRTDRILSRLPQSSFVH